MPDQTEISEDPILGCVSELPIEEIPAILRDFAPGLVGEPAFDPVQIARAAKDLQLPPALSDLHPTLEQAVRIGLAHIDATFVGDHPKYGTGAYAAPEHDGFPPTIVAAVDALTLWGFVSKAERLFEYWLETFIREDGTIDYYGTSLSEYGQLLTSAYRIVSRGENREWFLQNEPKLDKIAGLIKSLIQPGQRIVLPIGVPEADESDRSATYFHNAAWLARGLLDWAKLDSGDWNGEELARRVVEKIRQTWGSEERGRWLSPIAETKTGDYWDPPESRVTGNRFGSYTNYRYWPELLSSRILPADLANRIVNARLIGGGQLLGVTRFENHLDDWPLMDYLDGLHQLGRVKDFHISLWGHIYFHQAKDHFTAYEQVSVPPGRKVADYCLPCQLVAVRAAAYLALGPQVGIPVTQVKSRR